jgi:hypothetical protein
MSSQAAPEVGSATPARASFVHALPWCVLVSALLTLAPILILLDVLILVAHLPTFVVLLACTIDLAWRVRQGQIVSPITVAGFVGGLGASVALMGLMAIGVLEDPTAGMFYFFTWMLLPIFALVGSGFAAAVVGLGRCVFRQRSEA